MADRNTFHAVRGRGDILGAFYIKNKMFGLDLIGNGNCCRILNWKVNDHIYSSKKSLFSCSERCIEGCRTKKTGRSVRSNPESG